MKAYDICRIDSFHFRPGIDASRKIIKAVFEVRIEAFLVVRLYSALDTAR